MIKSLALYLRTDTAYMCFADTCGSWLICRRRPFAGTSSLTCAHPVLLTSGLLHCPLHDIPNAFRAVHTRESGRVRVRREVETCDPLGASSKPDLPDGRAVLGILSLFHSVLMCPFLTFFSPYLSALQEVTIKCRILRF